MYQRLDIEYVKNFIEERLYTLLEDKYINAHVKLKMYRRYKYQYKGV